MSAEWSFNKVDPSDVEMGITQRDQFNNEKVGLNDALVREVIQNSLDAKSGTKPVRVKFNINELSENNDARKLLQNNIASLKPNLDACNITIPTKGTVRVLTIEDFNTKGLTGSVDKKILTENFTSFWRLVGKSDKRGQKGGRWGLGKLVFSSSSKIRVFFGISRRYGDENPFAMGQVLLESHTVAGKRRTPHGFWHNGRTKERIQIPTCEPDDLHFLEAISDTKRRVDNGFTIIIPYIHENIRESDIVSSVLQNFYLPIFSKLLIVEVVKKGKVTSIDSATFEQVLENSNLKQFPVSFLTNVSKRLEGKATPHISKPLKSSKEYSKFSVNHLKKDQVEELKKHFNEGKLIHVKVPVELKHKSQGKKTGYFHLFVQTAENEVSYNFFARGSILLTAETIRLSGHILSGIVSENGDVLSEFLGDAETPSHTNLEYKAEKLIDRWGKSASPIISAIRNSLKGLYRIVSEQEEITDSDALSKFFSVNEPTNRKLGRNRHSSNTNRTNDNESIDSVAPTSNPVGFVIAKNPEGFLLLSTKDAESWNLDETKKIRVSLAYDMDSRRNPLSYYSRHDFDLYDPQSTKITCKGGFINRDEVDGSDQTNVLVFEVHEHSFKLTVKLHDLNRDLYVLAEVLE